MSVLLTVMEFLGVIILCEWCIMFGKVIYDDFKQE